MAVTVLTQTQIEDFFQSWTSGVLGTNDPSVVRLAWPTDGAPSWEINQDVCFLLVTYGDNPYTRQMQTDYSEYDTDNANVNLTYTQGVRVTWNLYGPASFDNADLVRANLFTDSAKTQLYASNLALIPDVPVPMRAPEQRNGQWWNRTTFYANFNELVTRQSTVPYIQTLNNQTIEG